MMVFALLAACGGAAYAEAEAVSCANSVPAVAPIAAGDVERIDASLTVGSIGPGLRYRASVVRDGSRFVRDDGTEVSSAAVGALVAALERDPNAPFDIERTGYDRAYLLGRLDENRLYLGAAASIPSVSAAFDEAYLDVAAMHRWYLAGMGVSCLPSHVMDYYPHLDVTVTAGSRKISIASSSSAAFLLPLTISDAAGARTVVDPGVSVALAGVLGARVHHILTHGETAANWADGIASSDRLAALIERDGLSDADARRVVEREGLVYTAYRSTGTTLDVRVALFRTSQFSYPIQMSRSSVAVFRSAVDSARVMLRALERNRWLERALAATPDATARIAQANPSLQDTVLLYRASGRTGVARCLETQGVRPMMLTTYRRGDDSSGAWWYVLRNGDLVLDGVGASMHFPLSGGQSIPRIRANDGRVVGAVLVDTRGRVLQPGTERCGSITRALPRASAPSRS